MLARLKDFWNTKVYFELKHGENIPRGYGWAGYNVETERVFVLPILINWLWSLLTTIYYGVVEGVQSREQSYTYKTGLQLGSFSGYRQGYMHGYTDSRNGKPNKVLGQANAH